MSDPIEEVRERLRSLISQVAALAAVGRGDDTRLPLAAHAMRQAMEILARPGSNDPGEVKRTSRSLASLITPIGSNASPPSEPVAGPVGAEATRPTVEPATDARPHSGLTAIRGIDQALAGQLSAHGVRSVADIAAWRAQDVTRIAHALDLRRRISRENWIEQAAMIAQREGDNAAAARSAPDGGAAAGATTPLDVERDRPVALDIVAEGAGLPAVGSRENAIPGPPIPNPANSGLANSGLADTGLAKTDQPDHPLPVPPEAAGQSPPSPPSGGSKAIALEELTEAEVTIVKRVNPSGPGEGARSAPPALRNINIERPRPLPRTEIATEKSGLRGNPGETPDLEAEVVILPPRGLLPAGRDPTHSQPRKVGAQSQERIDAGHGATSDEAAGQTASSSTPAVASGAVTGLLGRLRGKQNGPDRQS